MRFRDRADAGRQLSARLMNYAGRNDVIVLALPRGGVPVAYEVAKAIGAPLDVFLVRKLGLPGQEELAMGAIASGGIRVLNDRVINLAQPTEETIERVSATERRELDRREQAYRAGRPQLEVQGKTVILVDDGLATGSTMRAAVKAVNRLEPAQVVVAVPVGDFGTCKELAEEADAAVCLQKPKPLSAVGSWYADFSQVTDEEVRELLARSWLH